MSWKDFSASPEFQSLSPEARNQARLQYFQTKIADRVPEGREDEYLSAFIRDTQPDVAPQIRYQSLPQPNGEGAENQPGFIGDSARSVGAGLVGIAEGMAQGVEHLTGSGNTVSDFIGQGTDALREGRSDATREAVDNFSVTGNGEFSIRGMAQLGLEGVGSMAGFLVPGGAMAQGARLGLQVAGAAPKVASVAGSMAGFGTVGGLVGGSATKEEVEQEVLNADYNDLAQAPGFKEEYRKLYEADPEADHAALMEQSRESLALRMGDEAFAGGAVRAAAIEGLLGPVYDKILRGTGGVMKSIARGGATEFAQEASDAGVGKAQVNNALTGIDGRAVSQDVLSSAVDGGFIGALSGGAVGGVSGGANRILARDESQEIDPAVAAELDAALARVNAGQATEQDQQLLLEHDGTIYAGHGDPEAQANARATTEQAMTGQFGQARNTGLEGEVVPGQPSQPPAVQQGPVEGEGYEQQRLAGANDTGLPEPDGVIYGQEPDWVIQQREDSAERLARAREITANSMTGQFTPTEPAPVEPVRPMPRQPLGLPELGATPAPATTMMPDAEGRTTDPVLGDGRDGFTSQSQTQPGMNVPARPQSATQILAGPADAVKPQTESQDPEQTGRPETVISSDPESRTGAPNLRPEFESGRLEARPEEAVSPDMTTDPTTEPTAPPVPDRPSESDQEPGPEPIVEHTTKKGKTLRGVVRDISAEEALAIDPYAFRKEGGYFIREKNLNAAPVEAPVEPATPELNKVEAPAADIDAAANEAATSPTNTLPEPTDAQKEAGNYKKGKIRIQGLDISIENPKGSTRSGTDADGNEWSSTMAHHYGDLKGTTAADGDNLDVFIGPDLDSNVVFVIDQVNADGSFDEHKIMLGFKNQKAARDGYRANYDKGWAVGPTTRMTMADFKTWLAEGDTTRPVGDKVKAKSADDSGQPEPEEQPDSGQSGLETEASSGQSEPEAPESQQTAPIEDFGEKIEGARKDYATKLADAKDKDTTAVPMSESWPEPDYQKMLDAGADPLTVGFVRAMRDEIPAKPRKGWKVKGWAEQVEVLRDFAGQLMSGELSTDDLRMDMMRKAGRQLDGHVGGRAELYAELGHSKSLKNIRFYQAQFTIFNGVEGKVDKWVIERTAKTTSFGNMPRTLAHGDTKEEAIAKLRELYDQLDDKKSGKHTRFDIYSDRRDRTDVFIGKKIGRDVVRIQEGFDNVKAAREYLANNQQALEDKLAKMKQIPNHRRENNAPRVGVDHRNGGDVTPEAFSETFGFRGVQFGNYVEQGRRQADLNRAFDGLMDMAGILNLPPKALSLNGELGLAFGARGKGGKNAAAAHYESDRIVINLTKREGAGSLAHEWFHALDNYFSRARGGKASPGRYATEGKADMATRPEVAQAFKELTQTVNRIRLRERSEMLDRTRSKAYWATDVEMTARSFESYAIEKLKDQGLSNDYLANIVSEEYWKASEALGMEEGDSYPYPEAAEIPQIRAAYDNLFDVIETQEGEDGNVVMFSRGDTTKGMTAQAVTDAIASLKGRFDNSATVIQSVADLPEGLRNAVNQSKVRGLYDAKTDRVYLIADNLSDADMAQGVLVHELIGHKGLRGLMAGRLNILLSTLTTSQNGRAPIITRQMLQPIADRYGLDLSKRDDLRIAAEEYIAHTAQFKDANPTVLNRATAWLKGTLKQLGFTAKFTDAELAAMIQANISPTIKAVLGASEQALRRGVAASGQDSVRFSRDQDGGVADEAETDGTAPEEGQTEQQDPSSARLSQPGANFAAPDETLAKVAIRKIADKFKVLKDLQANIQKSGGTIDPEADAYRYEELFHGKAEDDMRRMREGFVEPMAKKMAKFGIEQSELDEYLYARHARERNAHIAGINPDMPDGGSGMTNAEADAILAKVRQSGKQAEFDQVANIVYDMLATRRDIIRQNGLEGDEMLDAWETKYQHYVPLKGFAENEQDDSRPQSGRGFTIAGKESKRAMGRGSQAASPSSYAVNDLTSTIIRRRKNEVGNAFLKLVESNPNKKYWEVFSDENPEMDRRIVKRRDPETGEQIEVVEERPIPMAMMSDRYFQTKRNGKTYYIKLEDQRLMEAMKNIGPDTSNFVIQTLASINRVLSALNTSYNPEFVVGNFARDVQTAVLNLTAEQSRDDGKAKGEAIAKQTVKDIPKAMKAIYRSLRGKSQNSDWMRWFDEFRTEGAKTGYFDMKDIDGQAKDIERLITMAKGGVKGNALKWAQASTQIVEDLNNTVENAVRLAAYVNARKAGISKPQAASLAKNMTVNFNRRGQAGTTLNALYMFANASIQGSLNFARTMGGLKGQKGDPVWSRLNTAQKIAVGMMGGAYALGMANRMGAGDDEDGENWYDKVPNYVKERNLVLMKSLFGGEQDGSYWTIPLPYGYNIFHVLGSSVEAMVGGNRSAGEAATDLTLAALGSFSPIGFNDSQSGIGLVLKNITPTLGKPLVDVAMNENFFGSSIYNENMPFGTPQPESSLSRRSTPAAYKAIAEFLNDVSGGSQWRSGAIDVNPDVMRYFVDYYLGAAGNFGLNKLPDNVYNLANGIDMKPNQVLFLSRVRGQVQPYADRDRFYERRDEIMQIEDEVRGREGAQRLEFLRENRGKLALRGLIKSTEERLKRLRKQRDRIYAMDLSPGELDERLEVIEIKQKQAIDRFNRAYREAIGGQ